jgi:hypothetical protein
MKNKALLFAFLGIIMVLVGAPLLAQSSAKSKVLNQNVTLTIQVNVANATIVVDNMVLNGNSIVLPIGPHTIKVSAPGYIDFTQRVEMRANTTVRADLKPQSYPLSFASHVKGITIYIDGVQIAGTAFNVGFGTHAIRIIANGYQEYSSTVDVSGPLVINVPLVPIGYTLSVSANVHGATVAINNIAKGELPYSEVLPPGSYTVVISAPGFMSYATNVNLNGPISINAKLQEERPAVLNFVLPKGFLDPESRDPHSQIRVYLDGKPINTKRELTGIQVSAGRHRISISSGDLYVQTADMEFEGGITYTLELFMELRVKASR